MNPDDTRPPDGTMPPSDVFIGRQAILDRERCTFGYELLYRDGTGTAAFDRADAATRAVIERVLLHWGMERVIGDRFGFINANADLIRSGVHRALPPEGIIFELHEDQPFDAASLDVVRAARREGYHFALDNVRSLAALERSQVRRYVSMVKVELTSVPHAELHAIVETARASMPGVLLVAEKVETAVDFALCLERGFDLFQGYFFAQPEVLRRTVRPTNVASAVALVAAMQSDDLDVDRVEQLAGSDPSLAFRLLSVVNSSAFGLDRRVESLRHAIVLLGLDHVRHLATLMALSASQTASEELVTLGAVRGRLASRLVPDPTQRSRAFTVGLLSVCDAIYQTPMEELVDELPLTDDVVAALLGDDGELGWTLKLARACESADVDAILALAPGAIDVVHGHYAEAIGWADTLRAQLAGRRSSVVLPGHRHDVDHDPAHDVDHDGDHDRAHDGDHDRAHDGDHDRDGTALAER